MFWIALSAALTAADLISKKTFTKRKDLKWILIRPTKNYGLIYNQLDDRPLVPKVLTGCITILLLIVLLPIFLTARYSRLFRTACSFLAGGAVGNTGERLVKGSVSDFLQFRKKPFSKLIFNLADVWLAVGGVLMVVEACRKP